MPASTPTDWTGERVRALRDRYGLSQTDFAAVLGFARYQSLSDIERNRNPVTATVGRLLDMIERHGLPGEGSVDASATPADELDRIAADVQRIARGMRSAGESAD